MSNAWDILISNSTLQFGDAWEHLNNQSGGTGAADRYVAANGLVFSVQPEALTFTLTGGKKLFQLTPSVFDFSASRTPITIKCKSVAMTFKVQKVIS